MVALSVLRVLNVPVMDLVPIMDQLTPEAPPTISVADPVSFTRQVQDLEMFRVP